MRLALKIFGFSNPGLFVAFALLAQILAPIGGVWSASAKAADPLAVVPTCAGLMAHQGDGADPSMVDHSACCPLCAVAQPASLPETPATGIVLRSSVAVVFAGEGGRIVLAQARGRAQARAPPSDV